jgi:hypothetical protein
MRDDGEEDPWRVFPEGRNPRPAARIGGMLQGDSARTDHVARGGGHSRMAAECSHFLQQNVRIFGHEILTRDGRNG